MSPRHDLSRRDLLRTGVGVAVTGSLAGCAGSEVAVEPPGSETVYRMVGESMRTLDPVQSVSSTETTVITQLFDGLAQFPNGNPEPELLLAEDVSTDADGTTVTVTLKPDVTFSDGTTLTASDVTYTFERVAAADHSNWRNLVFDVLDIERETRTVETDSGTTTEYVPGTLGVSAVDDRTVEIRLNEPSHVVSDVLAHQALSVVPEGIVGDVAGYDGELTHERFATENPVGAGPFELDSWTKDTEYSVTARDDYHGEGPRVDGIHWHVASTPRSGFVYARNENADAFWIPTAEFDRSKVTIEETDDAGRRIGTYGPLSNGRTVQYRQVPLITTYYIGFNTDAVEKPIRQAVAYAMNQQTQVDRIHKGRGETAYHITPRNIYPGGRDAYDRHVRESYPYGRDESDLDAARRVVEAAGYGPDSPAELTLTTFPSASWESTGKLLQDKLGQAHVDVTLETAPASTLITRGRQGSLSAFSYGWVMDYPEPDNFLQLLDPASNQSFTRWGDTPAAERAADAWETVLANSADTDAARAARHEAYLTMEEANWEDVTLLPKFHPIGEGFYYDWVDVPKTGAAGFSRHKYNQVQVGDRS